MVSPAAEKASLLPLCGGGVHFDDEGFLRVRMKSGVMV